MGEKISYNRPLIENVAGTAGQGVAKTGEMNGSMGGLEGMRRFFGPGLDEITSEIGTIGEAFSTAQKNVTSGMQEEFKRDELMSHIIDDIDVELGFDKEEGNRYTVYLDNNLSKGDGKSVNDGSATTLEQKYDDASQIGTQQTLIDITKTTGNEQQAYDGTSGIVKEGLGNINHAGGEEKQALDGSSIINAQGLGNINHAGGEGQQEYDANSRLTAQQALTDINNGNGLTQQQINERSKIAAQTVLKDFNEISANQGTQEQQLQFRSIEDNIGEGATKAETALGALGIVAGAMAGAGIAAAANKKEEEAESHEEKSETQGNGEA